MDPHQELVYRAKIAEQAGHFNETLDVMNHVAVLDTDITVEERNLLSLGYKKVIAAKCASLRVLTLIELKEVIKANKDHVKITMAFRRKVEAELNKEDYYRYLAEFKVGIEKYEILDHLYKAYEAACQVAKQAFDGAVVVLDSLNEDSYNDSTMIMQIMRDNHTLWDSSMDVDEDDVPEWIGKVDAPGDSAA